MIRKVRPITERSMLDKWTPRKEEEVQETHFLKVFKELKKKNGQGKEKPFPRGGGINRPSSHGNLHWTNKQEDGLQRSVPKELLKKKTSRNHYLSSEQILESQRLEGKKKGERELGGGEGVNIICESFKMNSERVGTT